MPRAQPERNITGSHCPCRNDCYPEASAKLRSWRLEDTDLYVTIEPCPMCMGAMLQARIRRVIFGAFDLKAGAAGSVVDLSMAAGLTTG